MNLIYLVGFSVLYTWVFWAFYVLVMGIYRAHLSGRLNGLVKFISYPFVIVGYFMDLFANLTIASVVFLELPTELMVTSRLQRHVESSSGWRFKLADWVCNNLLDIFDPSGNHC